MNLSKNYYTVREVSDITGIKPYTLRYWEEKLKIIRPIRLNSLHRRYTRKDIENIIKIKELMEKGYSIKGIKNVLYSKRKEKEENQKYDKTKEILEKINIEIKQIIEELSK